ncbi:Alpha/Beta hydrolase protein [Penicillium brevicompactum]|uniref:Alpha/Beta hydrolase protein n=1 Tax=Penicillium brevicompactum TaxID=5074 RepID=A0A9W9R5M9_PENBR|nr:Alpha/Beta hydrolase protein [Penicillium brevicompactum]
MSRPHPSPQTFAYKTDPSGQQVFCDVYIPADIDKPCPVIIWMHYSGLVFDNRHAAGTHMFYSGPKRGYIVVNIDYRLAPQAKMDDIYSDVEDCAIWVRTVLPEKLGQNVVETSQLIIGGGSCGKFPIETS